MRSGKCLRRRTGPRKLPTCFRKPVFAIIDDMAFLESPALNITYNVVGGILTIVATGLYAWTSKRWRRRRFQRVFGSEGGRYQLVYAPLKLHPDVKVSLPATFLRPLGEPFVFVRSDSDNARFSASQITSSCEIRAASYVASALGKDGARESTFIDCNSLAGKLDIDFISFGLISNLKTIDVFNNEGNDLVIIAPNPDFMVWKWTGEPTITEHHGHLDYGIILKIHPGQFPERTWIACAGMGEFGTSGAAWFLARKWKELERRAKGIGPFFALIAVEPGKDESAVLVNFGNAPRKMPTASSQ